jgi:hypothetical protein
MNDVKRIVVVVLGLIVLSLCALGIKGHMDSNGYKNQVNYTTAVQATDKDHFNYAIDSQQGRILANGTFSTQKSKQAKFPEMDKGYTYVGRDKEHYTMHTRTVCTSSGKTTSCHTEVYYTWDVVDSQVLFADKITFMGRNYNPTVFQYGKFNKDTDCLRFSKAGTSGFFKGSKGCVDGDIYLTSDDRYTYSTVPVSFTATFLASSYGGTLKGFNEDRITLQDKSMAQVLNDVGKYQLIGFWVFTIMLVIFFIAAGVAAYAWVMEDGKWSMDE